MREKPQQHPGTPRRDPRAGPQHQAVRTRHTGHFANSRQTSLRGPTAPLLTLPAPCTRIASSAAQQFRELLGGEAPRREAEVRGQ